MLVQLLVVFAILATVCEAAILHESDHSFVLSAHGRQGVRGSSLTSEHLMEVHARELALIQDPSYESFGKKQLFYLKLHSECMAG